VDVHPPHEPIRSWKDFLLHLLTITICLLIALALEAAVEALHHRHMVRDARENLAREMQANRRIYAQNLVSIRVDLDRLRGDVAVLRELRAGKVSEHLEMHWGFDWNSFGDSAWRTARDLGAVPYMPPELIEQYSGVYGQQQFVNEAGASILFDEAKAAAPLLIAADPHDLRQLTPVDVQSMLLAAVELEARLIQLDLVMQPLDKDYAEALRE